MIRLGDHDLETLFLLAELRLATPEQLAMATGGSPAALENRLRKLADGNSGYVLKLVQDLVQGPGRPRHLFALGRRGAQLLLQAGRVPGDRLAAIADPPSPTTYRHVSMLNTLCVLARCLQRRAPFMAASILAAHSPLIEHRPDGKSILCDHVSTKDGELIAFEPDAALCLRHLELNMALLFFVEADRGTEPRNASDERAAIAQKLTCYRRYFSLAGYRRYQDRWECPFRGFRLLMVTETQRRYEAVCRLVCQGPASQFVWITEHTSLLAHGLHGKIWAVGGNTQLAAQSILDGQQERVRTLMENDDATPAVGEHD